MSTSDISAKKIVHPQIPFSIDIPGEGLSAGSAVLIRGVVKDDPSHRFNIDLTCGRLVNGDHRDNVALHFNPRFNTKAFSLFGKPDNQIVLNSLMNNVWMMEHRAENPLQPDKPFSLRILVLKDYYKITLNGKLLADYVHRISVDRIKCLYIDGAVQIEQIEFQNANSQSSTSPTPNAPSSEEFEPKDVYKPSVPFVYEIGELAPQEVRLTGTPRMNGNRFEFNLLHGTEYLFHFRVDLPNRDVPQGFVVRNSTIDGHWLNEERDVPFFPFKVGHTVDVVFILRNESCEVNVDGRTLCIFNYRNGLTLKDAKSLTIVGDVVVQSVHLL